MKYTIRISGSMKDKKFLACVQDLDRKEEFMAEAKTMSALFKVIHTAISEVEQQKGELHAQLFS